MSNTSIIFLIVPLCFHIVDTGLLNLRVPLQRWASRTLW